MLLNSVDNISLILIVHFYSKEIIMKLVIKTRVASVAMMSAEG